MDCACILAPNIHGGLCSRFFHIHCRCTGRSVLDSYLHGRLEFSTDRSVGFSSPFRHLQRTSLWKLHGSVCANCTGRSAQNARAGLRNMHALVCTICTGRSAPNARAGLCEMPGPACAKCTDWPSEIHTAGLWRFKTVCRQGSELRHDI